LKFDLPGVNIVCVTYGMPEMCVETIQKLYEYTDYPDFDITVIDNHSLDNTWKEVCKELYRHPDTARGLQSHGNLGYGKACNIGALVTSKPLILFLNSDAYPHPDHRDWLTNLVDTLVDNEDIGVVAPKLVNRDGLIMGSGVRGTNKDRYVKDFLKPDEGQCDTPLDVLSVCGACMLVKRQVFMSYGGFDEIYKFYFEEEDFCWRIRHEGLRIRYEPSSVVVHDHMGSCKDQQLLSGFAGESRMIFYGRWGKWMEEDQTVYEEGE
jgi:GT2 family glycosyltransferase